MNEVKPGTRCECHDVAHHGFSRGTWDTGIGYVQHCPADAVRLIPVLEGNSLDGTPMFGRVALCAACAEFHEKKVSSR